MIIAVDSSALALLVNPTANPPREPLTGEPVTFVRERIEALLSRLSVTDTILIPTPVLAEALVRADTGAPGVLAALTGMARIRIRPFGQRAAVETAFMTRAAIEAGDKRGGSTQPWQKIKVDRQIVAIARVEGATQIYADDAGLVSFAKLLNMDVISTWDLPVPEQESNLFTATGVPEQPAPPDTVSNLAAITHASENDQSWKSSDKPE